VTGSATACPGAAEATEHQKKLDPGSGAGAPVGLQLPRFCRIRHGPLRRGPGTACPRENGEAGTQRGFAPVQVGEAREQGRRAPHWQFWAASLDKAPETLRHRAQRD